MKKLPFILLLITALLWSFGNGYWLGYQRKKIKYITKEVEIVKQVAQKRAIIQARPNITRDRALELMRAGKL